MCWLLKKKRLNHAWKKSLDVINPTVDYFLTFILLLHKYLDLDKVQENSIPLFKDVEGKAVR